MGLDKRWKADFTWVLSGNVLYSACQWGAVVFLAKLGSPEQVGEYALGLAVSAPVMLFANFQLRALLASDVGDQFAFGQYLAFRLVSLGAALVAVAGAAALTEPGGRVVGITVLLGLAQTLDFVSETYYGFMQRHDRMDRLSTSLLLKGPLSLAALGGAMYFTRDIVWAVVGLIAGRLLILLTWDSRLAFAAEDFGGSNRAAEALRLQWDAVYMRDLFRLAFPLGVISMLVSLNASIPRLFVEAHRGSAELGIFSAIASLLSAGSLVVSAYGQSIFLPVAQACAQADRTRFRSFVVLAGALGGVLGGAGILLAGWFGPAILTHLFRKEYAAYSDVFVRLMIAGTTLFVGSGLGYVMTAARSLRPQIPLLIASAAAAAAVSAWSIPRYGLRGAADAVLAAALVQLVGAGVILLRIDRRLSGSAIPHPDVRGIASQEQRSFEVGTV
jgi:O-antigen/teichoic acid export membrane protein